MPSNIFKLDRNSFFFCDIENNSSYVGLICYQTERELYEEKFFNNFP